MPGPGRRDGDDDLFLLEGVVVARDGERTLGPVDLAIAGAGLTVIAGPSGAGKSTLLRLLNRLDAPTAGRVLRRGRDVAAEDPTVHRRRVAMVFQRPVVLPGTVLDNLRAAEPGLDRGGAQEALARTGLDGDLLDRDARDLSGGEAQRLCLARSLATQPEVVLFDEPTSSLDPAAATRIEGLATDLAGAGVGVVWVTHDLAQLRRIADHVVVLVAGQVAQAGPATEVLGSPAPQVERFLAGEAA